MARPRKTSPNGFSPKDRRAPDPSGRRRVPLLRARHETTASPRVQMASVLAIVFDAIASPYNQTVPGTGPNPRRHIGMTCVVACPRQPKIRALAAVAAMGRGKDLGARLEANDFEGFDDWFRSYLSGILYQWHATGDLAR